MNRICLIGETDPFVASLLQRFAETSGLQAVRVQVGQDLPVLAEQPVPDVIILEAELPGKLRGWEAALALKANAATAHIPIVSCSWLPKDEASALIGEAAGYLKKPDLYYEDFVAALSAAGVQSEPDR